MIIKIWTWPEADHAAWLEHCGGSGSFQEARDRLVAVIANVEQQGHTVETVEFPVKTMLDELKKRGLENTSNNRAAIAASWREKE